MSVASYDQSALEGDGQKIKLLVKELCKQPGFIELKENVHGRCIISFPLAGIANASVRDWFKAGIQGEDYCSAPYISSITKTPCVTLSAPIQKEDGTICGVVGIDIKL